MTTIADGSKRNIHWIIYATEWSLSLGIFIDIYARLYSKRFTIANDNPQRRQKVTLSKQTIIGKAGAEQRVDENRKGHKYINNEKAW